MASNYLDLINKIVDNKYAWDATGYAAKADGDIEAENRKKQIANDTKQYYDQLKALGYGNVADELSAANYNQSTAIRDKWAKMGKTPTRDYYYSLGKKYNLSQSDIDNLIGWDNVSQELSFGGQKVGKPDAVVDGVSYWADTSVLDKSFNDYITRSGTAIPTQQLIGQNNTGVKEKIDEYWGTIKGDRDKYYTEYDKVSDYVNKDVTKTDEYQSTYKNIMGKYDMSAMQGRNNAIASGSASNGGNIDSYAAANAMRQQTAITAEGQALAHQLGLGAYQARMDNARQLLSDLGVYQKDSHGSMENAIGLQQDEAQRLFENDETAKNNETARLVEQSKVSGLTPTKWTYDQNIYLNSDGTVRDEYLTDDFDATGGFQTIINNTKAKLATATDPEERANLQATIDQARQAKALKTYSSPKYAKWAHEVEAVAPRKTADYDTNLKQIDASVEMTKDTNAAGLKASELEAQTSKDVASIGANANIATANIQAKNNLDQINAQADADAKLLDKQAKLSGNTGTFSETGLKSAKTLVNSINTSLKNQYGSTGKYPTIYELGDGVFEIQYPSGKTKEDYKVDIIDWIVKSSLSDAEQDILLAQLGYDDQDVLDAQNAKSKK